MSGFQFLLDENVDPALQRALARQEPNIIVWHIGDPGAPPRGTLDPGILVWCEGNGFSLVTNNRVSMPNHLRDHLMAGHRIPGIFTLDEEMTIGATVEELVLLWAAAHPEEYADQINFLPITY